MLRSHRSLLLAAVSYCAALALLACTSFSEAYFNGVADWTLALQTDAA